MQSVWSAQFAKIADGIDPSGTLPEINWDEFEQAQREALGPYIAAALVRGLAAGARDLGIAPQKAVYIQFDWNLINENAIAWAQAYTFDLIHDITATTRASLTTAINDWLVAGEAFPDLRRRVEEIFEDPARAELIAVTETTRAVAEGNTRVWQAAGVKERRWETAVDELVCPICGALHKQTAAMGSPFEATTAEGKVYRPANPPAHPGCRCTVRPVVNID